MYWISFSLASRARLEPPQEPIREQTTQAPARGRSIYRKRRAAEIVVPREEESLLVAMAM